MTGFNISIIGWMVMMRFILRPIGFFALSIFWPKISRTKSSMVNFGRLAQSKQRVFYPAFLIKVFWLNWRRAQYISPIFLQTNHMCILMTCIVSKIPINCLKNGSVFWKVDPKSSINQKNNSRNFLQLWTFKTYFNEVQEPQQCAKYIRKRMIV